MKSRGSLRTTLKLLSPKPVYSVLCKKCITVLILLNQDDINNVSRSISSNETETVIKNFSLYERPRSDGFTDRFCQMFEKEITNNTP